MGWDTTGCTVTTGKDGASSILFARVGSQTVRQRETVTTQVIRGLTEEGGINNVPPSVDATIQRTYYAYIDDEVFSISALEGTKIDYSGSRTDDSGQWQVTITTTEYAVEGLDENIWGEDKLNQDGDVIEISSTGVEYFISYDRSLSYVFAWEGNALFSTSETTNSEIRYIDTESNARSIASSLSSNTTLRYTRIWCHGVGGNAWRELPVGTEVNASVSRGPEGEGWTVHVTTTKRGYQNASGNTSNWS